MYIFVDFYENDSDRSFSRCTISTIRDFPYDVEYRDISKKIAEEIKRNIDWWDVPVDFFIINWGCEDEVIEILNNMCKTFHT